MRTDGAAIGRTRPLVGPCASCRQNSQAAAAVAAGRRYSSPRVEERGRHPRSRGQTPRAHLDPSYSTGIAQLAGNMAAVAPRRGRSPSSVTSKTRPREARVPYQRRRMQRQQPPRPQAAQQTIRSFHSQRSHGIPTSVGCGINSIASMHDPHRSRVTLAHLTPSTLADASAGQASGGDVSFGPRVSSGRPLRRVLARGPLVGELRGPGELVRRCSDCVVYVGPVCALLLGKPALARETRGRGPASTSSRCRCRVERVESPTDRLLVNGCPGTDWALTCWSLGPLAPRGPTCPRRM